MQNAKAAPSKLTNKGTGAWNIYHVTNKKSKNSGKRHLPNPGLHSRPESCSFSLRVLGEHWSSTNGQKSPMLRGIEPPLENDLTRNFGGFFCSSGILVLFGRV
jgi:hypothetical protein